jgi:hypothetical protein
VGAELGLAVVAVEVTAVLVRDGAPAPVGEGMRREFSENLGRVDPGGGDGAQVGPVVAEVEGVDELFAWLQRREPNFVAGLGALG